MAAGELGRSQSPDQTCVKKANQSARRHDSPLDKCRYRAPTEMVVIRTRILIWRTFETVEPSTSPDSWRPLLVDEIARILEGAPFRWWISGGNALDLHLGDHWREHGDLDVGICRNEAERVHEWFSEWDLWLAAAGELSPWDGRPLNLRRQENNVWARRSAQEGWAVDLTVNECTDDKWVYRREPSVTRDWTEAVLESPSGVPYLAPELQLLFKSKHLRGKDHADASHVIPAIDDERRVWLSKNLSPDHPWQEVIHRSSKANE